MEPLETFQLARGNTALFTLVCVKHVCTAVHHSGHLPHRPNQSRYHPLPPCLFFFLWLHNCANSTPSVRAHHVIVRSVWPRRDWEAALATLTANTPAHLMKRRFLVVRCCVPGLIYKPTRFLEIWREAHTRETSEPLVPNAALALPSASPRCARRCLIAATPGRQLTGA